MTITTIDINGATGYAFDGAELKEQNERAWKSLETFYGKEMPSSPTSDLHNILFIRFYRTDTLYGMCPFSMPGIPLGNGFWRWADNDRGGTWLKIDDQTSPITTGMLTTLFNTASLALGIFQRPGTYSQITIDV